MTNSIDDFLNHKSGSGGGGSYLKRWKKDGEIVVWLHTGFIPTAVWQHPFPKPVVTEDKDTGEARRNVWGGAYTCHEGEDVLKKQFFHNNDGSREVAPRACGFCRTIEWFRLMVGSGKLHWCKPIFRFEATDPRDTRVVHAGGIFGAFGDRKMTEAQKAELAKYGISPKVAWNESAMAKGNYLFVVVNDADPGSGVQKTTETGLLGDKVKEVIRVAMSPDSLGPEKGDPMRSPYPLRWIYMEKEILPQKKYAARRVENKQLTPQIAKLIRGPMPEVGDVLDPFDPATLRAVLEQHCLIKGVPWDKIFEGAAGRPAASRAPAQPPPPEPSAPADAGDTGEEMFACDKCDKPMLASATTCPHCGERYDVETAPAPPPPLAKRSAAARGPAASPPPPPTTTLPVPDGNDDFSEDSIPF